MYWKIGYGLDNNYNYKNNKQRRTKMELPHSWRLSYGRSFDFLWFDGRVVENNTKSDLILDRAWYHLRKSPPHSHELRQENRATKVHYPSILPYSPRHRGKLLVEGAIEKGFRLLRDPNLVGLPKAIMATLKQWMEQPFYWSSLHSNQCQPIFHYYQAINKGWAYS